jgi:hypothetical protein
MLTNEMIGAMGVMARRAADVFGEGDADDGSRSVEIPAGSAFAGPRSKRHILERRRCIAQFSARATHSGRLVASAFDLVDVMRCGQGDLGSVITDQGGAIHDASPRLDNSENKPARSMAAQALVGQTKPLENFVWLQTLRIGHEFLDDLRRRLDEIGNAADGKSVQPFQLHRELRHFHHDRNTVDHRRAVDSMPF